MNTSLPTKPPTIVVVFARLGSYHLARLRAASAVLAREQVRLVALSIAGTDKIYAWDPVDAAAAGAARVLFPNESYEAIAPARLRHALYAALNEIDPLAVALPGWAFAEARAGLDWCARRRRGAILMSESSRNDHLRIWLRENFKRALVRKFGAALVGGSRHRDYVRHLGMPKAAIFTGYDAVDNDYFREGAARIRTRAAAERMARGLPARYVLTSSRFVPEKNLAGLLRGFALYAQTPGSRDLVLCGDGALRSDLEKLARDLGVEKRVHWPGFVQYPDLPAYYALADAFILASTTEPWGLVVNEAMASGLPVLISDACGCAPDLVRAGENGFTFSAHQPMSVAAALSHLSDDPAGLARMGAASQQLVEAFAPAAFGAGLMAAARLAVSRLGSNALIPGSGA